MVLQQPARVPHAENNINSAPGGRHGIQSNAVRTCLRDGLCDGAHHPSDHDVGARTGFPERVDRTDCADATDLPASIE